MEYRPIKEAIPPVSQQTPENTMQRFQNVMYVFLCNCSRVNTMEKKKLTQPSEFQIQGH